MIEAQVGRQVGGEGCGWMGEQWMVAAGGPPGVRGGEGGPQAYTEGHRASVWCTCARLLLVCPEQPSFLSTRLGLIASPYPDAWLRFEGVPTRL